MKLLQIVGRTNKYPNSQRLNQNRFFRRFRRFKRPKIKLKFKKIKIKIFSREKISNAIVFLKNKLVTVVRIIIFVATNLLGFNEWYNYKRTDPTLNHNNNTQIERVLRYSEGDQSKFNAGARAKELAFIDPFRNSEKPIKAEPTSAERDDSASQDQLKGPFRGKNSPKNKNQIYILPDSGPVKSDRDSTVSVESIMDTSSGLKAQYKKL